MSVSARRVNKVIAEAQAWLLAPEEGSPKAIVTSLVSVLSDLQDDAAESERALRRIANIDVAFVDQGIQYSKSRDIALAVAPIE